MRADIRISTASSHADSPAGASTDTRESQTPALPPAAGRLQLQRLAGNQVSVSTAGADADLGVCYCDALLVDTRGGDIVASHLNCQGAAGRVLLDSGGGAVRIGGLDGTAEIRSGDGDMTLQVRACQAWLEARAWCKDLHVCANVSSGECMPFTQVSADHGQSRADTLSGRLRITGRAHSSNAALHRAR